MSLLNRREFLAAAATSTASLGAVHRLLAAQGETAAARQALNASSLRVVNIEKHEVLLPYHDFNAKNLFRYHGLGIQLRTVYIVKTNYSRLEGYGEAWGRGWPDDQIKKYMGTNPFDWIGDTTTLPINMAMYDVMGKYLGIPAWKLIGPKRRDRIPVAAWTVSQLPQHMAAEVLHAAQQGYRWLKYHVDEVQNVIDQTAAMQKVAPAGFQVHYDFNANSIYEAIAPVIKRLERFPIAGRMEDPIVASDPDGWKRLRDMTRLPILVHHAPVDFMVKGLCDGLMSGHAAVGAAAKIAALAESTNTPIMLQNAGGTLNQAFLAHQAAVFPTATIDHVNLARLWSDDVTNETMRIVDGHVNVPQRPGLGVTLNRLKLKKYVALQRPQQERFLVRIRYRGGPTIYVRHNPEKPGATDNMRFLKRLIGKKIPGPVPAYDNPVATDFWDDQTSPQFQEMWQATEKGAVAVE